MLINNHKNKILKILISENSARRVAIKNSMLNKNGTVIFENDLKQIFYAEAVILKKK